MDPRSSDLRARLAAHAPADATERAHLDRMLELVAASRDPFSRRNFVPGHFTASAFVLSPNASELLLIHHRKLARWLQPGGHVEPGDADVLDAATRELREETGLEEIALEQSGIFDLDVHTIPARGDEPAHDHFDVRMLFRARSCAVRAGSDAGATRFVALDSIDREHSDESVMRAVRKLQQLNFEAGTSR